MNWKFWRRALVATAMVLQFPVISDAGVILTLDDRGVDFGNLSVGQTVTVDVVLSGLGPADELGYLAATVGFNSTLLGTAFNVTPGAIVPDALAFIGSGFSGVADGNYDFLFSAGNLPLTTNGVFFSLNVTGQSAGSGTFDFTFLDALDSNNDPVVIDSGAPLDFTVNGSTAVPEPSSFFILVSGVILGLSYWHRQQTSVPTSA